MFFRLVIFGFIVKVFLIKLVLVMKKFDGIKWIVCGFSVKV